MCVSGEVLNVHFSHGVAKALVFVSDPFSEIGQNFGLTAVGRGRELTGSIPGNEVGGRVFHVMAQHRQRRLGLRVTDACACVRVCARVCTGPAISRRYLNLGIPKFSC